MLNFLLLDGQEFWVRVTITLMAATAGVEMEL